MKPFSCTSTGMTGSMKCGRVPSYQASIAPKDMSKAPKNGSCALENMNGSILTAKNQAAGLAFYGKVKAIYSRLPYLKWRVQGIGCWQQKFAPCLIAFLWADIPKLHLLGTERLCKEAASGCLIEMVAGIDD